MLYTIRISQGNRDAVRILIDKIHATDILNEGYTDGSATTWAFLVATDREGFEKLFGDTFYSRFPASWFHITEPDIERLTVTLATLGVVLAPSRRLEILEIPRRSTVVTDSDDYYSWTLFDADTGEVLVKGDDLLADVIDPYWSACLVATPAPPWEQPSDVLYIRIDRD